MSQEGFSALQSVRGQKKGKALRDELVPRAIELREEGWTQQQIADELGVTQRTVSNWLGNN